MFVDEAYADFSGETLIGDPAFLTLHERRRRTDVRQGVRPGRAARRRAGGGTRKRSRRSRRTVPPYSLNVAAAVALPAALRGRRLLRRGISSRCAHRASCSAQRSTAWTSDTGRAPRTSCSRASAARSRAGDRRPAPRARSPSCAIDRGDPGCEGCIRITTGVVEHTTRCIEALEEVLCGAA